MNVIVHDHGKADEQNKHGAKRPLNWHDLWELADAISQRETSKSLPGRAALKTLHETRNLAHHSGVVPGAEAVTQGVEPTRGAVTPGGRRGPGFRKFSWRSRRRAVAQASSTVRRRWRPSRTTA